MAKTLSEILLLEPGGEIRVGDGAPGVNFTGLRIIKTVSSYRFETYKDDVLQMFVDADGRLCSADGQAVSADVLDSDNIWRGVNTFLNSTILGNAASIGSSDFISDLATGHGMKLWRNEKGRWSLELDKLAVRGTMQVLELLFMQKRTFNGSLLIGRTGTGKPKETFKL